MGASIFVPLEEISNCFSTAFHLLKYIINFNTGVSLTLSLDFTGYEFYSNAACFSVINVLHIEKRGHVCVCPSVRSCDRLCSCVRKWPYPLNVKAQPMDFLSKCMCLWGRTVHLQSFCFHICHLHCPLSCRIEFRMSKSAVNHRSPSMVTQSTKEVTPAVLEAASGSKVSFKCFSIQSQLFPVDCLELLVFYCGT